ncbi:unnamed protein product, partial [Amoebophrya sp. A25]
NTLLVRRKSTIYDKDVISTCDSSRLACLPRETQVVAGLPREKHASHSCWLQSMN